jgi:manganese/zinc/iron transport system permease protein
MSNDFWIILTAGLVSTCSALLGVFLILRKMSMLGDAISHAVLPGLVIAYFISGDNTGLPMLMGAAVTGILVTLFIELLHKKMKLQQDAAIGLSFTFLFSVGVILINVLGRNLHIDQECVLYGEIAYVPLELSDWFGMDIPRQVWILTGALLLVAALIGIGFKGFTTTTFDPEYAAATGIAVSAWHYALMGGVSLNTVVAFESVGAILVIAFLIGPPAIAFLLTSNLKKMMVLSVLIGLIACFAGYYWAKAIDSSIAGCISVVIGGIFTIVLVVKRVLPKNRSRSIQMGS